VAHDDQHPGDEQLAQYAEGTLIVGDRAAVECHLAACADCRTVVAETMAFSAAGHTANVPVPSPRAVPFRRKRWVTGVATGLAAAAALVLAIRVSRPAWLEFGPRGHPPGLQGLVNAAAHDPTRLVEGRLTGGFKYAPAPSPTRGADGREVSPDVKQAAAQVEADARNNSTPEAQAALGVAYLAVGNVDRAIAALSAAVARRPDASFENNLSAAHLTRGRETESAEDLRQGLAAADRAIALNPNLVEAYFNRAWSLDALGQTDAAITAWNDYLAKETDPGWAREAAQRVRRRR
jgi:tetratricopeptide (TPR) repeat protein